MKHSKYSGSMFHRIAGPANERCPGSARLAASVPEYDDETPYSREGDQAHALLSLAVGRRSADTLPENTSPEMVSAIQDVLAYVGEIRDDHPDLVVITEQRFFFPQSVVHAEDAAGTLDLFLYSKTARRAWVADFKYGVGELVNVVANVQLLFYATSVCWDLAELDWITLVIFQPRAFNGAGVPQEWDVTPYDLVEFQADAEQAIRDAEHPFAPLIPGERQCHWCPAGHACLARERLALDVITENPNPIREYSPATLRKPADLGMDRVGYVVAFKDFINDWLRDVEGYAVAQARSGVPVPGRKLVYAQARRRWNTERRTEREIAEAIVSMGDGQIGLEEVFPRQLLGITEIEKRLIQAAKGRARKGGTPASTTLKDELAWLTVRDTSGNVTLVSESDHREAIAPARDNFGGVVAMPDFNETPTATFMAEAPMMRPLGRGDHPIAAPALTPGVDTPHGDIDW